MSIDFEGIKSGTVKKIDLSQFDRGSKLLSPETYLPQLKNKLGLLSERLNAEHGDFFEANGQIKMAGKDSESDGILMAAKEQGWAADCGKTLEAMEADREKNPANIAEIAITLLFDKILHDEFIIVRASVYDDYENGADQLIIDKQTGAVICGLDDAILGSSAKDDGQKKMNKIDARMKNGGAIIKYGATIADGKLTRKNLSHVPIFYFNLSKKEMDGVLRALVSASPELTAAEIETYAQLINSLTAQVTQYGAAENLHYELKDNLKDFAPSLAKMQSRI